MKNDLLQTPKGDFSISEFLNKTNVIANNLAHPGRPMDDDHLVHIIMNNVGTAFGMIVNDALDNLITYEQLQMPVPSHQMLTRSKTGSQTKLRDAMFEYVDTDQIEPYCFNKAITNENWRLAMAIEFTTLQPRGTWILVLRNLV